MQATLLKDLPPGTRLILRLEDGAIEVLDVEQPENAYFMRCSMVGDSEYRYVQAAMPVDKVGDHYEYVNINDEGAGMQEKPSNKQDQDNEEKLDTRDYETKLYYAHIRRVLAVNAKYYRFRADMTQEQLALKAGISRNDVRAIENVLNSKKDSITGGKHAGYTLWKIAAYAFALDVTLEALFSEDFAGGAPM